MKGPGIKDYCNVIEEMKKEAHKEGKRYIDINAKELHASVSPNHITMPTCCQAIYKHMLSGDEIIKEPRGKTGFSSRLTVRFYVEELEGREQMFPNRKRGRPAKSEEEKLAAKIARKNKNTEELRKFIKAWLGERGWKTTEREDLIEAYNDSKHWVISIQGIRRGKKQPFPVKLIEVIKHMDDANTHYSIALNDSLYYRRQWNQIPKAVKNNLNMSIILADKKGNVIEL